MPTRLCLLLLMVAAVPAFGQTNIQTQIAGRVDAKEQRTSQVIVHPGQMCGLRGCRCSIGMSAN